MSDRIEDLVPAVAEVAQRCVNAMITMGIPHAVTSTLRTLEEQAALYAQGREPLDQVNRLRGAAGMPPIVERMARDGTMHSDNDYTVTNDDGIAHVSNHQGGRALDVVPADAAGNPTWPAPDDSRWGRIAEVFKSQGFQWGGSWETFPDFPHYEML